MLVPPFYFLYYHYVMNSNLAKIQFCFPDFSGNSNKAFLNALVKCVRVNRKVGYAGFIYKKGLKESLTYRFSNADIKTYKTLSPQQKKAIRQIIIESLNKCFRKLPLPEKPLFVFIFPLLAPFDDSDKQMGFSTGFCPYKNTIHLYIAIDLYSTKDLQRSVSHEYNHAVFFNYHEWQQSLLKTIIFEGLAENFEEEIVKDGPPLYATALSKKRAREIFHSLKHTTLRSKSYDLYRRVFFGDGRYKKWTGYSIGYRIVKSFLQKNKNKSWQEIIRMDSKEILQDSGFVKN